MYLIIIDGGGTKTDLVLLTEDGAACCRLIGNASCPTSIGLDKSFSVIVGLIEQLIEKSGISRKDVIGLYAGIAGCGVSSVGNALAEGLRIAFPEILHIGCGSDVINALNCGLYNDDGMALVCGTGSALLVRSNNKLHQVGGWGYLLGDEGSGYDFGRMGLTAALKAFDGRGEKTVLSQMLNDTLGLPVQDAISQIYEGGKQRIASLAPVVLKAAVLGDMVAVSILEQATEKLCHMLITGSRHLETKKYRTVLIGGLWNAEQGLLKRIMEEKLPDNHVLIQSEVPPIYGAAIQAFTTFGFTLPHDFTERFTASLDSLPKG